MNILTQALGHKLLVIGYSTLEQNVNAGGPKVKGQGAWSVMTYG